MDILTGAFTKLRNDFIMNVAAVIQLPPPRAEKLVLPWIISVTVYTYLRRRHNVVATITMNGNVQGSEQQAAVRNVEGTPPIFPTRPNQN